MKAGTASENTVLKIVAEVMGVAVEKLDPTIWVLSMLNPSNQQAAQIWHRLREEHDVPVPDDCISLARFRTLGDIIAWAGNTCGYPRTESDIGVLQINGLREAN